MTLPVHFCAPSNLTGPIQCKLCPKTQQRIIIVQSRVRTRLRSGEEYMAGDVWPIFLYANCKYHPENPWEGFLKNVLLIKARFATIAAWSLISVDHMLYQGFKHIFTSPSSVEKEAKATRSGNARIHGMTAVTPASIAYVATQVAIWSLLLTANC